MGYPCRCRKCGARKSFKRKPTDYFREKKCSCGGTYRIDWYRKNREFKGKVCYCGELVGKNGPYPHRPGSSVWCREHPTGPTEQDYIERYGNVTY